MIKRVAYCDSSVLVKRYVREPGSAQAAQVMRRHRVATSSLASLEIASALVRREAGLGPGGLDASLKRLRDDQRYWLFVEVTASVVARAEEAILAARLRCLDAIHVSSAIALQREIGPRVLFVTADRPQQQAAIGGGLSTILVA